MAVHGRCFTWCLHLQVLGELVPQCYWQPSQAPLSIHWRLLMADTWDSLPEALFHGRSTLSLTPGQSRNSRESMPSIRDVPERVGRWISQLPYVRAIPSSFLHCPPESPTWLNFTGHSDSEFVNPFVGCLPFLSHIPTLLLMFPEISSKPLNSQIFVSGSVSGRTHLKTDSY